MGVKRENGSLASSVHSEAGWNPQDMNDPQDNKDVSTARAPQDMYRNQNIVIEEEK